MQSHFWHASIYPPMTRLLYVALSVILCIVLGALAYGYIHRSDPSKAAIRYVRGHLDSQGRTTVYYPRDGFNFTGQEMRTYGTGKQRAYPLPGDWYVGTVTQVVPKDTDIYVSIDYTSPTSKTKSTFKGRIGRSPSKGVFTVTDMQVENLSLPQMGFGAWERLPLASEISVGQLQRLIKVGDVVVGLPLYKADHVTLDTDESGVPYYTVFALRRNYGAQLTLTESL